MYEPSLQQLIAVRQVATNLRNMIMKISCTNHDETNFRLRIEKSKLQNVDNFVMHFATLTMQRSLKYAYGNAYFDELCILFQYVAYYVKCIVDGTEI